MSASAFLPSSRVQPKETFEGVFSQTRRQCEKEEEENEEQKSWNEETQENIKKTGRERKRKYSQLKTYNCQTSHKRRELNFVPFNLNRRKLFFLFFSFLFSCEHFIPIQFISFYITSFSSLFFSLFFHFSFFFSTSSRMKPIASLISIHPYISHEHPTTYLIASLDWSVRFRVKHTQSIDVGFPSMFFPSLFIFFRALLNIFVTCSNLTNDNQPPVYQQSQPADCSVPGPLLPQLLSLVFADVRSMNCCMLNRLF